LSSVPVQLLIYVMDPPICGAAPVFIPLKRCMEVEVNVTINFNISAIIACNSNISVIDSILVTSEISGMTVSNTTDVLNNASVVYNTFTWKPLFNQVGSHRLCLVAFST